ncbi:MAG TPA: hypothetical protein EYP24_01610, partial [bacterium (Candidatus Stahlbacteria)]|nr:hypothetical protein [Candidatus Stahlbacteria bacterium]
MTPYLVICLGIFSLLTIRIIKKSGLKIVLPAALIARALLFFTEPSLSEDPYRYLWDGERIAQGESPYQTSPKISGEERVFYEKIK